MMSAFLNLKTAFWANDTYCVYLLKKTALQVFSKIQNPPNEVLKFGFGRFSEEEKLLCGDTKPENKSVETATTCLSFSVLFEAGERLYADTQLIAQQ